MFGDNRYSGSRRNLRSRKATTIRFGDLVIFRDRYGVLREGRAIAKSSLGGWFVRVGNSYSRTYADSSNIVKVIPAQRRRTGGGL